MLNQQARQLAYIVAMADAFALCVAFGASLFIRSLVPASFTDLLDPARPVVSAHIWILFLCIPLYWVLASQSGLYQSFRARPISDIIWMSVRPFFYLGMALATAIFIFHMTSFSRTVFVGFLFLSFLAVLAERLIVKAVLTRTRQHDYSLRRLLIVGTNHVALQVGKQMTGQSHQNIRLFGHLTGKNEPAPPGVNVVGGLDNLKQIVEEQVIDEVIFAIPVAELLDCEQQIAWCEEVGVTVHLKVDFVRTLIAKTYPTHWDGIPLLTISSTPSAAMNLLIKRSLDLAVSGIMLVLLTPFLLLIAAAIRLSSPGPVIFSQKRVGLNGRLFDFYKFRSMYRDAEERKASLAAMNEAEGPVFKIKNDPRITPVGRWLRRLSLDELPQLWNVLKGEMSLVGPRPPVPQEVTEYQRWQRRRLSMKPGLTCLWQVNGRSSVGFDEWMKLDLAYIDNWSLKLDLIILLRTVPAVLFARGAH